MAVINLCLTAPLSSLFGAVGVAGSIYLAYLVRTSLMNVLYYRELKLDMVLFYKSCYTTLWLPILTGVVSGMIIKMMLPGVTWVLFRLKGCIVCLMYGFALVPCFNTYERNLLKNVVKRFKR